jgi:CheY-like chemotaxis protein
MVDQILSFSNRGEKERKPVYLKNILKEVLFLTRSSLPPDVEIRIDLYESQSRVSANLLQVHQVIMNVCNNAAYAMKEDGGILEVALHELSIGTDRSDAMAVKPGRYQQISISDTGLGMDEKTKKRIFEPYFTTKRVGEGNGLGLSVAHGIIKSHGGTITVDSEPGKGTTFHVFLPVIKSKNLPALNSREPVKGGNEWVLMADDETDLLETGRKTLEALGYTVVMKKSSIEALDAFNEKPDAFNLVITDQTMPGMTGVQLTKELKRIRGDIPVILCTGFSEVINEENYKSQGIDAFVMKPFDKKKIAALIRQALDKK